MYFLKVLEIRSYKIQAIQFLVTSLLLACRQPPSWCVLYDLLFAGKWGQRGREEGEREQASTQALSVSSNEDTNTTRSCPHPMISCIRVKSLQLCPTLRNPMDCIPPGSSALGFSRQEYWGGFSCPSPGDLPNPGIEPSSLMSICIGRWILYH